MIDLVKYSNFDNDLGRMTRRRSHRSPAYLSLPQSPEFLIRPLPFYLQFYKHVHLYEVYGSVAFIRFSKVRLPQRNPDSDPTY